jgi:hypothetical protein
MTTAITMELKVASKASERMTKRKLRGISAMSSAASSGKPNMKVPPAAANRICADMERNIKYSDQRDAGRGEEGVGLQIAGLGQAQAAPQQFCSARNEAHPARHDILVKQGGKPGHRVLGDGNQPGIQFVKVKLVAQQAAQVGNLAGSGSEAALRYSPSAARNPNRNGPQAAERRNQRAVKRLQHLLLHLAKRPIPSHEKEKDSATRARARRLPWP